MQCNGFIFSVYYLVNMCKSLKIFGELKVRYFKGIPRQGFVQFYTGIKTKNKMSPFTKQKSFFIGCMVSI